MWSSGRSKKKSSSSSRSSSINEANALAMFQKYADEDDPNVANMEGISQLSEDLGIDPLEDIRILVLLWKLEAAKDKPAQISQQEWMAGCQKLQVDSMTKFESLLPQLDIGFLCQAEFKDFYKVCVGRSCFL